MESFTCSALLYQQDVWHNQGLKSNFWLYGSALTVMNLNLALKDMHSRNVKGARCTGNFSCDNNKQAMYRIKSLLRLLVPEAQESSKAGRQNKSQARQQDHVCNHICKAESTHWKQGEATNSESPATVTRFLQQGFTLPQTV